MRRDIWGHFRSRLAPVVRTLWGRARTAEDGAPVATTIDVDDRYQAEMRLGPGHLVTLTLQGPALLLLPEPFQYVDVPALVLVEELSRAIPRRLGTIIGTAAARASAEIAYLERLASALKDAGFLTSEARTAPRACVESPPIDAALVAPSTSKLTIAVPRTLVVEDGEFRWFDQAGGLQDRLSAEEVDALRSFLPARTTAEAFDEYVQRAGRSGLGRSAFQDLADRLRTKGLLVAEDALRSNRADPVPFIFGAAAAAMQDRFVEAIAAREPGPPTATTRVPVIPVNTNANVRPLSLGLLLAHASEFEHGRLRQMYDLVPLFFCDAEYIAERARTPSIFLFSNYLWNLEENLALSALVKRVNPENITIHGGPSTPKYEEDAQRYFDQHPHVDVAVRGEGEATFVAMLAALDVARPSDLRPLADVKGLTFRLPTGLVRTPDRERISDLDTLPSPYLLGMFEPFGAEKAGAIIETNRGCPYGCTFCDWGSATLSKIRLFSLERVFAELEWSASHRIEVCALADANFGIIERDVLIAEKIAELKRQYGYPRILATNYAKNTVTHLRRIIEVLADVKVLTEGVVSLQSMDRHTLKTIKRSNIKLEQYDALTTEFRRAGIPLAADIMMGLPGSTPAAFRNDLQQCVNRDVTARVNYTQLLPNSPMNEPSYRQEHGISAGHGEIVKESTSYTRDDWEEMARLREAFSLFDTWGVLRYVASFVRQETGIKEVEFYNRLQADAGSDPRWWPFLTGALRVVPLIMSPPGSWALFLEEVEHYLIGRLGMQNDDALRTVIAVQRAHLPAPDRSFPEILALPYDFAAWYKAVLAEREDGHRDDWETVVPSLRDYPPGELVVDDPHHICRVAIGKPMGLLAMALQNWELQSPVSRPRMGSLSAFASSTGTDPGGSTTSERSLLNRGTDTTSRET